jgi:hypothetical protein
VRCFDFAILFIILDADDAAVLKDKARRRGQHPWPPALTMGCDGGLSSDANAALAATIWTIWASIVSRPTFSVRMMKHLIERLTLSPGSFATGIDSPVTNHSSRRILPRRAHHHRNLLARAHAKPVAQYDDVEGDLFLAAVAFYAACGLGR